MESPETRRRTMQAVKSQDTAPELLVRRMLHAAGYRYRLHLRSLPGCPDLVFPAKHRVIFINGCFWHGHSCARGARTPKSNAGYWVKKIEGNRKRDARNKAELKALGWRTLTLWECQLKSINLKKLEHFLN